MTVSEFAKKIDHTILNPNATYADVRETILYARDICAASICLNPSYVTLAHGLLKQTETAVCTVIGFPLGAGTSASKAFEAEGAFKLGATELDMVINIGALLSGDHNTVRKDIKAVVDASPATVKVILENCFLSPEQIATACRIAEEAGAHYVKTSTGFGKSGAKLEDVKIMRESVSPSVKIKAAGGIRTMSDALAMINAGADRLGLSATASILAELESQQT